MFFTISTKDMLDMMPTDFALEPNGRLSVPELTKLNTLIFQTVHSMWRVNLQGNENLVAYCINPKYEEAL